jgi:hypothetical protein
MESSTGAQEPSETSLDEVSRLTLEQYKLEAEIVKAKQATYEREAELEYRAKRYAESRRIAHMEAQIRSVIAGILVLATFLIIAYGMMREIQPDALAQYLAPVTGLAGIAVGYFFGRGSTENVE